jgi:hypothetical protein
LLGFASVKEKLAPFHIVSPALLSPNIGADGEVVGIGRAPRTEISHGGKPMKERTIKLEFSSRQVVIIVALIALAAIMLPISVQAATGSSVNITDPTRSAYKAKVSGVGALITGLCSWNNVTTQTCATVTNHSLNTVVNGGFVNAATDIPPLFPLEKVVTTNDTVVGQVDSTPFNPNEEVEITSLTLTNLGAVPLNVVFTAYNNDVACNGTGGTLENLPIVAVPGNQTVHLPFPQPIVVAGNGTNSFCIEVGSIGSNTTGSDVRVTIVGYEF